MTRPTIVSGLAELADHYDGFILDQWGVLHDGQAVPPDVPACLDALRQAGKPVVILSNSGRRAAGNERRLAAFGLDRALYATCISSGEVLWQAFRSGRHPIFANLGRTCLLLSRGGDRSVVEGVDLATVDTADRADFVLLTGSDAPETSLDDYADRLRDAARRHLPMICANPDLVGLTPDGPMAGAGAIARVYEAMGAPVHYVGKPFPAVFGAALAALSGEGSPAIPPQRVCVIGDSLTHDIAGGRAMTMATALVTSGLHAKAYGGSLPADPGRADLDALFQAFGVTPDWALPALRW